MNTGDTNTGVANSGDVNTGAFISGNYSNGAFWRGDYQGLLGFSYRPAVLPQTPFLDLTLTGGLGSVVIPAIDIPAIRPEFSANVAIDSFTVPSIPIPQIDLAATTVSVGLGPITVPHLDIPRVPVTLNYLFGSQPGGPLKIGPITGLFNTPIGLTPLALSQIVIGASSSQGTITAFLANLPFSTPVVTIDEIPLLASITGHSEPVDIFPGGLTIPAMNPLSINLSGGTGAVTIPAITIGEIPFDLVAHSTLGPVHILIDLPAVPGFGNTTGAPSSGFFNSGAGGVSGFGNVGAMVSGGWNQAPYTGSFNAGQANTGGFNPGSVNTGWLNTGDTNTGVANSGDVNTGAFISGNYSNGAFWRGDYQGLLGFSYTSTIIPEFTVANIHASGGAGPIIVPSIQFPAIPLDLSATGHIGGFTIPPVSISPITVRIDPVFDLGPITVQDITIPALGLDPATGVTVGPIFSSGSIIDPFSLTLLGFINVNVPAIQTAPSEILPFTVLLSSLGVTHLTPEITIPGFHIPVDPIHVELPLSVTIGPFVSPEITIPQLPLGLALSGATPAFAFPPEITIDRIPVVLDVNALLGPINAGLVIPPVPGFGNTTAVPSSGFFNIGGGGGLSGFHNLGAGMSGVLNAISDPLLGSASGFANFGTQLSGILNRGADISGVYNTGALGLITSALVSGFGNVGQQLAGLIYTGTGP